MIQSPNVKCLEPSYLGVQTQAGVVVLTVADAFTHAFGLRSVLVRFGAPYRRLNECASPTFSQQNLSV